VLHLLLVKVNLMANLLVLLMLSLITFSNLLILIPIVIVIKCQ